MLQARWPDDLAGLALPHVSDAGARALASRGYQCLGDLVAKSCGGGRQALARDLNDALSAQHASNCLALLDRLPSVSFAVALPRMGGARGRNGACEESEQREAGGVEEGEMAVEVTLQRHDGGSKSGRGKGAAKVGQRARVYAPRWAAAADCRVCACTASCYATPGGR
jgi:hypothetical protein